MPLPATPTLAPVQARAFVYRSPISEPVRTSFGVMHDRPSVLVRVEDADGAHGWGEIWCNFPNVGAEHRARLFESCVAPLLLERRWDSPIQAFETVSNRLQVLALQTGEPGPVAQVVAGMDIALWDLAARKLGQPLWRLFGGTPRVRVYASGISPTDPCALAAGKHAEGYRAFKLKVGFGEQLDVSNLRALRLQFGDDTPLMIDANQAWDLDTATRMCQELSAFRPEWVEEPMRVDAPPDAWRALAKTSPIPLAGGENMRGTAQFRDAIEDGCLVVIQPDPGKWGGFSGNIAVAREAIAAGRTFCPHWLGGGVGLAAAMQLRAAMGNGGYVEVDSNPNPLRDRFAGALLRLNEGQALLPDAPGIGVEPDLALVREFLVWQGG